MASVMETRPPSKVALVTLSNRKDIEVFALLCESIDRLVHGHERHYVIVGDDDVPLFAKFAKPNRAILSSSQLLPSGLGPTPSLTHNNARRPWWSFRSKPAPDKHVQPILKIAAALQLSEQRFCFIDSDNLFVRTFDVAHYAGGERTPLYFDWAAITAGSSSRLSWLRSCDRFFGNSIAPHYSSNDSSGTVIVWDKSTVHDLVARIESDTGANWPLAFCQADPCSEYMLYSQFVLTMPDHTARHEVITGSYYNARKNDLSPDADDIQTPAASLSETVARTETFSGLPEVAIASTNELSCRYV